MKMKLINWHLFSSQTIEIKNNTVVTGENGSGKSTLLDALQYVLTGGKAKFNSAANDSAKRTIESYIRGKTGIEGKEYLRNGDVVSYIVLEYFDETSKRSQLIGVVFDLSKSNIKKETFFNIMDCQISDELFGHQGRIYNRSEFKRSIKEKRINADFIEKKSEVASLFRQALGVNKKYFELIPKALAFRPINQVYNFIFDFLLNENPVKIDDLKNNVRAYRDLGNILKDQEERLEYLERIDQQYTIYQDNKNKLDNHNHAHDFLYFDSLEFDKSRLEKSIKINKAKLTDLAQVLIRLEKENVELQKEVLNLNNLLDNNEGYKLKKQLEERVDFLTTNYKQTRIQYEQFINKLKIEIDILKRLKLKNSFVEKVENKDYDSDYLKENLITIKDDLNQRKEELDKKRFTYEKELEKIIKEYNELVEEHKLITANHFSYRSEVQELINVLQEQLYNYYNKKIEVKPLCEYLEVTDESWRDAIEGYLNTQRFDIIIEAEYFNTAMQIYEQYKDHRGIFGVGIVDVAKLSSYKDTREGSLATKVTSYNQDARNYANMLLNRVQCVDDVQEIRNYKTAITKTCMVYNNFTVRAIRPSVYKRPFIGLEALKIQKEQLEIKLDSCKGIMDQTRKLYNDTKNKLQIIKPSEAGILLSQSLIVDQFVQLQQELDETKAKLKEIKLDDSFITLVAQLDECKLKQKNKQNELNLKQRHSLECEIKIKEDNQAYLQVIETLEVIKVDESLINDNITKIMNRYYKRYGRNYSTIMNVINNRIKDLDIELNKDITNVCYAMKAYNHQFKVGYGEDIADIKVYRDQYYNLRDIEISKRIEDVRNARRKCEQSFQESFISRLYEKIVQARKDIDELNKGLKNKNFNGDSYEFIVGPSKRKEYRKYYDIITTNQKYTSDDLFVTTLSEENRAVMNELFNQIALLGEDETGENVLQKYTDYREYLDYDIKITHDNGDITYFSKVNREKSGGETQTPFYVVIASSFEQLIKNRLNEDSGCIVLFDEAFNNMDETRIQEMMKFYNELNVQVIVAVPPARSSTIMPYVDTTLMVIKAGNHSFVEGIIHE